MSTLTAFFQQLSAYLKSGQIPQLGYWSYFLLAIAVAVEGPITTLLGAAAASAGFMRPGLVFLSAAIGNLTADSLWYTLGYVGKIEWVLRFGRRLGVRPDILEKLEHGMRKHTIRILFIAKLTISFVIPSLIAAGLVKAPWRKWFPAIFGGEMIWTGFLVLIGYYTTEAIKRWRNGFEYLALFSAIAFVVIVLVVGRRMLRKQYTEEPDSQNEK
ncbi:MAG: VTT domain-containing protein [Anaerolineales bacterium]